MKSASSVYTGAFLTLGLLLGVGESAGADDDTAERQPKLRRSVEILADMDRPELEAPAPERSWLLSNIHIKKKRGLEYTHVLRFNDRPLMLNVQGPVMRKRRLGLTLELRY